MSNVPSGIKSLNSLDLTLGDNDDIFLITLIENKWIVDEGPSSFTKFPLDFREFCPVKYTFIRMGYFSNLLIESQ